MPGRAACSLVLCGLGLALSCSPKATLPAATATSSPAPNTASTFPGAPDSPVPPELAAMLRDGPCVPRMRVALKDHLNPVRDQEGKEHSVFLIEPGEKLCLVGSTLQDLTPTERSIPVAEQPQRLVSVEAAVLSFGTVFVLHNKFDLPFEYRALVKRAGKQPQPTSVCTVAARLSSVEHWPEGLELVAFGDFKSLEPGSGVVCR